MKPVSLSRAALWIISTLLFVPVGVVAVLSGAGLIRLPFEMFLLAERLPVIFRAHMLSAAAALLLAPVTIAFRHRPDIHRLLGRSLGAFVVLGGLTAIPVALMSQSAPLARAGFLVQGLVWLALLAHGWSAIRRGDRPTHVRAMLAMTAVTTGAVWFRLITGTALLLPLPFEAVYATAAWAGWMTPLALVWRFPGLARAVAR